MINSGGYIIEIIVILLGLIMVVFPDILAKRALAGRRMITVTPNKLHQVIGLNKTRWVIRIIGIVLLGISIYSVLR